MMKPLKQFFKNLLPLTKWQFDRLDFDFVPGDLWIGAYIKFDMNGKLVNRMNIYICLIPTCPIQLVFADYMI